MNNVNKYGEEVKVVLIHGGPGARGSLEDLAEMLSEHVGVLEINQSKYAIDDLIEEMKRHIENHCHEKIVLLGHSWGAWLVCLFAYKYPEYVHKVIMVGSGSFEQGYVEAFHQRRLSRLTEEDKSYYDQLMKDFTSDDMSIKDEVMAEFGQLMAKLDTYETISAHANGQANFKMFQAIWSEANNLRKTGELLEITRQIKVPIHIIQGDYDSHSIEGIIEPFDKKSMVYTYDIIEKCGHYPWREKYGKDRFIDLLIKQMDTV